MIVLPMNSYVDCISKYRLSKVTFRVLVLMCVVLMLWSLGCIVPFHLRKLHAAPLAIKVDSKQLSNNLLNDVAYKGWSRDLYKTRAPVMWNVTTLLSGYEKYVMCQTQALLIILITSARHHLKHRNLIRKYNCELSPFYQCIFLIGQTSDPYKAHKNIGIISEEMDQYHDILLGSYEDTYRHLTHKVMHGYYWIDKFCQSRYVLKTDDDCFINSKVVYDFLRHSEPKVNLYVGRVNEQKKTRLVVRDIHSRWFVSLQDYPLSTYPQYSSGIGYLLSSDVIARIVDLAPYVRPISVEDAYFGILIDRIGVVPVNSARFMVTNLGWHVCNLLYLFVVHRVSPAECIKLAHMAAEARNVCHDEENFSWT